MTEEPIYMLNALWFKKNGGAENYNEYIQAVLPFVAELGVELEGGLFQRSL